MKVLFFVILVGMIPQVGWTESEDSDVAEKLFQSGMAALEEGSFLEAADFFGKVLILDPKASRARLELAVAEEQLGNLAAARKLYGEVLLDRPPEAVVKNINLRLLEISIMETKGSDGRSATYDARFGKRGNNDAIRLSVASGFFYDSNVNAGPETDTIFIFNLPFVLSDDAKAQSDFGYQFDGDIWVAAVFSDSFRWTGNLGYSRVAYSENRRFDFDHVWFATGPEWQARRLRISAPFRYGASWLGGDLYTQTISATPSLRWAISPEWESTTYGYTGFNLNDLIEGRGGWSLGAGQAIRRQFGRGRHFVQGRVFYGREFAEADFLASQQAGAGIGVFLSDLPGGFDLFAEPSFRYTQYDEPDPFMGEVRKEPQLGVNVNLGHSLPWWGLEMAVGYTYTNNYANTMLYEYQRHQVSVLFHREF